MKRAAVILLLLFATVVVARVQDEVYWPTPEPTPYEWPTPYPTPMPTPVCDHTSNSATRFEQIRLLPPLKIKNFDLHNIEYLFADKIGLHVGSLTADGETAMPPNIWKEYKSKQYWILYCAAFVRGPDGQMMTCGHIYTIVEVAPEQMKKEKAPRIKPL